MPPRHHGREASLLAAGVARSALRLAGIAIAGLVLVPAALLGWRTGEIAAALLVALASACGLLALGLSGVLRLNAALFQLMASHDDEIFGGMRADEFLARAGLQAEPAVIRRLSDRAGLARRLQTVQLAALAGFAGLSALALAVMVLR